MLSKRLKNRLFGVSEDKIGLRLLICAIWYLVMIHVIWSVGRQKTVLAVRNRMLPNRIERPAINVGTVANLYPRTHLQEIISMLQSMKCHGSGSELDLQMGA